MLSEYNHCKKALSKQKFGILAAEICLTYRVPLRETWDTVSLDMHLPQDLLVRLDFGMLGSLLLRFTRRNLLLSTLYDQLSLLKTLESK
jgi:hypothetical protein